MSPEDYALSPEHFRNEFIKMLGFPLNLPVKAPKLINKTFVAKDGDTNIYRMQFEVLDGIKYYGIFFEQPKSDAPFLIGFHGKEGTPEVCSSIYKDSSNYNHMIRRATDRGASVFVGQNLLWNKNEYKEDYDREWVDSRLRRLGGSVVALELYITSCLLSYFAENHGINMNKVGAFGLSYGGMYTVLFSAIDKRVRACCSCSWFSDTDGHTFPDWCHNNAEFTFGNAQIAGLVAPRPMALAMGNSDQIFNGQGTLLEGEMVKEYYKAFNKQDNLICYLFDGVHEFDTTDKGLDFLFEALNND
jgi:dienelactone hydrolase